MNAFSVSSYVFIILDSYTMALIKSVGDIFIFDSHARNCFGMPDPNGSAVVMKCADIKSLEQYLHQLSFELGCETFEIVPVEFYPVKNDSPTKTKRCNETDIQKCARLQKAREYKKQKILVETETVRQNRLEKDNNGHKSKILAESDLQRQVRLRKNNECRKRKISVETEVQKKTRLEKMGGCQRLKYSNETESEKSKRCKIAREHQKNTDVRRLKKW